MKPPKTTFRRSTKTSMKPEKIENDDEMDRKGHSKPKEHDI